MSLLHVDSGPGRAGPLTWSGLELRHPAAEDRPSSWEFRIRDPRLGDALPPGEVLVSCEALNPGLDKTVCSNGRISLPEQWLALDDAVDFSLQVLDAGGYRLSLADEQLTGELHWDAGERFELSLERLDLAVLQPLLDPDGRLAALGGRLSGQVQRRETGWQAGLRIEAMFFDTIDGLLAGDQVELTGALSADPGLSDVRLELTQPAGELLLGALYLPPPERPLALDATLGLADPGRIEITRLVLSDPDALRLSGSATLRADDSGWQLTAITIDALEAELARLWPRWLDGPAAAAGFAGIEAAGRIEGALAWRPDGIAGVNLRADSVSLRDPRERIALTGASGRIRTIDDARRIELDWQGLELLGLQFDGARARLHHDEVGLRLLEPVRVGLLDGAVVVDGLAALRLPDAPARLVLDARIEPVDLAALTGTLGLPELGGRLAGRFPGVTYSGQQLAFTGGIDVDAFSGRIAVEQLVVERPLGSAPALSAQVEFERLDLLQVTGAFGFGRMEGQVSGYARDLRLLNWRPVAMDARLYTHSDVPRRRISQRAVENLSSLGGGSSALLSGTVLRVFEDFPYRRAGLSCRLGNNICHIDGVAAHESGGFVIVEGRSLPRLDIVGHRRLVDWPQLMGQVSAMLD